MKKRVLKISAMLTGVLALAALLWFFPAREKPPAEADAYPEKQLTLEMTVKASGIPYEISISQAELSMEFGIQ